MTHPYPLHVAIRAQCFCCQSLQPFTFTSPTDQVVCASCLHHLGPEKAERRDAEHIKLWVGQYADQQENHRKFAEKSAVVDAEQQAVIDGLAAQVAELRGVVAGQFDRTKSDGVRALLESDLVRRAERKTVLAQRQIDWAMAVLWRVGQLHHADPAKPTVCACGRSASACAEGRALDPQRQAVLDWEKKNVALLHAGARHALPEDHPEVTAAQRRL
ncbi:hypothetical protein E3T37_02075 [Cryobacterium sp. TMT2-10]|uniref:Uncharacterized protein n=1 Tax=Cryobacterium shii TaxID=1259235 RepID=A0AAQ2C731_9MICO|nr:MULTISPECIES: hypothetical protein [Cryobacterium]TFC48878.1 hypothetical protein E3O49_06615 [Cryobacterium shii]TFC82965.1 hypothetical protein E3T24_12625 [Cryobacterium sp. TmT2-59]TFD25730.1 hypothetical protein E3T32_03660 [Cryobacterium sp. TMT2-23]TFD42700.1 hypothetical protein E3T37_02075 [Cryobacterium sp. TMT2-10]